MTKFKKLTKDATVTFCRNPCNYNKTKVVDTTTSFLLFLLSFVFDSLFHVFRDSIFRKSQKSSIVFSAYALLSACEMSCWNLTTSCVFEVQNVPSECVSGVTVTFNFNMKCKLVTPGNSMR